MAARFAPISRFTIDKSFALWYNLSAGRTGDRGKIMRNLKIIGIALSLIMTVTFASCGKKTDTDGEIYSLTYIPLTEKGFDDWFIDWGKGNLTKNGFLLTGELRLSTGTTEYYEYRLTDTDGNIVKVSPDDTGDYYREFIETVDGNYIVTGENGDTSLYDADFNVLADGLHFYHAEVLDGGRYFAVNDTTMTDFGYARGADGGEITEKYSLYRLTERLTDCKYDRITLSDGGFDCVYTENGGERHDFFAADDIAGIEKPPYELVKSDYDYANARYSKNEYLDADGKNAFGISFDAATGIVNDSALVKMDGNFYILRTTKE